MKKLRVLEVSGSNYEMGLTHGTVYKKDIRSFTEDRVKLSMSNTWTGRNLSRGTVLKLADTCVVEHEAYAPQLMDELRGLSAATGLSLGELIINNGFTDFIDVVYAVGEAYIPKQPQKVLDDCTAFLVSGDRVAEGHGFYGQTWDMHNTATEHVILLRGKPADAPEFLAFTITGCVGMIGMNEYGIAVGINNLVCRDGQIGVTWPFVVRKILMQKNIADALACITEAKLAGSHNFMLMDKDGTGYNIEAMPSHHEITKLDTKSLVHTNHCLFDKTLELQRERTEASQVSSQRRLELANDMLSDGLMTPEKLMELTRADTICAKAEPPMNVESSGAAIMCPATGDFWAVWGRPVESEYEHFTI